MNPKPTEEDRKLSDTEIKVETVPEKFDHLHPYPEIYYVDDEDVYLNEEDEEDFCFDCFSSSDECICGNCIHGTPDGADCDRCKEEAATATQEEKAK